MHVYGQIIKSLILRMLLLATILCALLWFTGCSTTSATRSTATAAPKLYERAVHNYHGPVAVKHGAIWSIQQPPALVFTGKTISGAEVQQWARAEGIQAISLAADASYAQVTHESWMATTLWLKQFNEDTGYTYLNSLRDCDNFARRARAYPDLFSRGAPPDSQALVFGLYAHMAQPFAGVSDGYHALNVAWTDWGVPVYEPQGRGLTYQDIRAWPNKGGITHALFD